MIEWIVKIFPVVAILYLLYPIIKDLVGANSEQE